MKKKKVLQPPCFWWENELKKANNSLHWTQIHVDVTKVRENLMDPRIKYKNEKHPEIQNLIGTQCERRKKLFPKKKSRPYGQRISQKKPLVCLSPFRASLVTQMAKNLPAMQETWVWSLGKEDPLEKGVATHSSILARRTPWTEEPSRLQSMVSQRVEYDWLTDIYFFFSFFFHSCFYKRMPYLGWLKSNRN